MDTLYCFNASNIFDTCEELRNVLEKGTCNENLQKFMKIAKEIDWQGPAADAFRDSVNCIATKLMQENRGNDEAIQELEGKLYTIIEIPSLYAGYQITTDNRFLHKLKKIKKTKS